MALRLSLRMSGVGSRGGLGCRGLGARNAARPAPQPACRHLSAGKKRPLPASRHSEPESSSSRARILRMLGSHVWPSAAPADAAASDAAAPAAAAAASDADATRLKARVVGSVSMLVAGKLLTIQVPFIFKALVDSYSTETLAAAAAAGSPELLGLAALSPAALLAAYGASRAAASGLQEARNLVFSTVAQRAIRSVRGSVFAHLQSLDMGFHLNRSTGALARVLDRGGRSIQVSLFFLEKALATTTKTNKNRGSLALAARRAGR